MNDPRDTKDALGTHRDMRPGAYLERFRALLLEERLQSTTACGIKGVRHGGALTDPKGSHHGVGDMINFTRDEIADPTEAAFDALWDVLGVVGRSLQVADSLVSVVRVSSATWAIRIGGATVGHAYTRTGAIEELRRLA